MATGYRPNHLVKDDYLTCGVQKYYDTDRLEYGKPALGTITFLAPYHYMRSLWVGKKISVQEGATVVGYATVKKIFNKHLEKKETYLVEKKDLQGTCYYEFQVGKHTVCKGKH